jgi:stage V sporulation protein AD
MGYYAMNSKKVGNQTVVYTDPPVILSSYSIVGPMEGKGPLGKTFDLIWTDSLNGEKSWELAESKMLQNAMQGALSKSGIPEAQIDYILTGDLLNQIMASNFAARTLALPFIGLYGACSTMALSIAVGSMLLDGGFAQNVLLGVSSHHDSAERQFRLPTEHGSQRAMSAQWTVSGAGSLVLAREGSGPRVTAATIGRVLDYGEKDVNNLGAAMAPAVADTIINHFQDLNRKPKDYDLIISGDLGTYGLALAHKVLQQSGVDIGREYTDCGIMIYNPDQDVHAGASGCACSAVVMAGSIMQRLQSGELKRVLLVGSGSLHSPTSALQGESIPGIGHAVVIEA